MLVSILRISDKSIVLKNNMTIRITDECPNCEKNLKNHVEDLGDKFYEPFNCPYCNSTLALKQGKYRIIALIGALLIISLLVGLWCSLGLFGVSTGCHETYKDLAWNLSQLLIAAIFFLLWLQDLKIVSK